MNTTPVIVSYEMNLRSDLRESGEVYIISYLVVYAKATEFKIKGWKDVRWDVD